MAKRKGKHPNTRFDFLGYCFGPKAVKNKKTKEVFTNFTPQVSASSLKSMRKRSGSYNFADAHM